LIQIAIQITPKSKWFVASDTSYPLKKFVRIGAHNFLHYPVDIQTEIIITTNPGTGNKCFTHLMTSFQDKLGKPVPECQTILDFTATRDDGLGYWHQRADERHGKPPPR